MTDTAQPFPDEDAPEGDSVLRPSQLRRLAALTGAREALTARGGIFGGSNVNDWAVDDLLDIAEWIVDGERSPNWPQFGLVLGAGWCRPADFSEGRVQAEPPAADTEAGDPEPDDTEAEPFDWDSSGALPK